MILRSSRWPLLVVVSTACFCGQAFSQAIAKIDSFQGEYRFLSNFWPAEVVYEGVTYPSVEHAYQAAKTLSIEERKRIASLPTPGEAKKEGQKLIKRPD